MATVDHLPDDLVRTEHERHAAYRALASCRPTQNTALRRRLLRLTAQVWWHPFWETKTGRMSAARAELRTQARRPEQNGGPA
ncbi:hypothetical protein [Streptomyces sp. NPDC001770]